MSGRGDAELIQDMLQAAQRAMDYCRGMDYPLFLGDTRTQDAVVRNIQILGEAAKNTSEALRLQYDQVPWRSIAGMRDRLVHGYFGVNLEIVWNVVTRALPDLEVRLRQVLADICPPAGQPEQQ
ncbi:MAG: DUF86 domain-containing protein [Candidatus Latescibacterota bacterium]